MCLGPDHLYLYNMSQPVCAPARVRVCVCARVQLDSPARILTAASGDGELDVILRKGRRQGAITLLFSPHVFFFFLLLLTHVAPLLR